MKKYLKPAMETAEVRNITFIAASGGDLSGGSDTDFGSGTGGGGGHHGDAPSWRKGF